MAWNIPGKGGPDSGTRQRRRQQAPANPWKPRGDNGGGNDFDGWSQRLRGLFDGGGGGNPAALGRPWPWSC